MKHYLLLLTALCVLSLHAQQPVGNSEPILVTEELSDPVSVEVTEQEKSSETFLSHLSVGLRSSTLGIGLQAATPINDYFNLRAGIDFAGFKTSTFDIGLEDTNGEFDRAFGYTPDYSMKGELNFTNGNILVDYHPTKGVFHLTAGLFIGTNKLKAKGFLADYDGNPAQLKDGETQWPVVDFDGHQLSLDDANLNADLQLGGVIKPYFGLGVGRAVSKNNRLTFKFELGMIYQGNYSLKQNGKKVNVVDNAAENFEDIDTYTRWLKWWPMLNFQLSYRIF